MRSQWIRAGSHLETGVLREEGNLGADAERGEGHIKRGPTWRWPCQQGGRHGKDAATRQGMPGLVGTHQKPEEARKDPPGEALEGAEPC